MTAAEVVPTQPGTVHTTADWEVSDMTAALLDAAIPENTAKAYANVRASFEQWCATHGRTWLPATEATLTEYVAHLIELCRAPSTVEQHIAGIRTMHRVAGYKGDPDTERSRVLLRAYKRQRAKEGVTEDQALPLTPDTLRQLVDLASERDALLLVLGFTAMLRRSELAGLQLADLVETAEGVELTVRVSKTDKESVGRVVALPPSQDPALDPVRLSREWKAEQATRGITGGPLLGVTAETVNDILQRLVRRAGLPDADQYSAHSLRAGGFTAALLAGIPVGVAARHGGWDPESPTVHRYARVADRWRDNAMRGVL